ncbi:MAG: PqqD family protein [Pyrinomonadaceae bacterium]
MNINPIARKSDLVVQETSGEVLVYDLKTSKAHCLNGSAALVWRSCNGSNSVADIVREFESTGLGTVTEDFVWLAVDQLNEIDLLESNVAPRFNSVSRRRALKTIGLASAVALPVIASLVAPQQALGSVSCACQVPINCAALTGCPSQQVCNTNFVCAPVVP